MCQYILSNLYEFHYGSNKEAKSGTYTFINDTIKRSILEEAHIPNVHLHIYKYVKCNN